MAISRIQKEMLDPAIIEKLDGINLTSPDGTKWVIKISNTGEITATKKTA